VVINISSVIGRVAGRGYLAYGTAKAALAHYTRLAAADLAPRIRVNAIAVGSVATSALDIVLTNEELRERMERATRSAGSAIPRTSPPQCFSWPRRPAATSPARSSRSTAASASPTSISDCRTCEPGSREPGSGP
jgi:NAD(P)-dependent dehydrogenase (short-subunit alcohol dehydrogenase family)